MNQTLHMVKYFQKLIMACREICSKYKAKKEICVSRYQSGQKRCSVCAIFLNWDGSNCPCCGMVLRTGPRGTQDRQRLLLVRQKQ